MFDFYDWHKDTKETLENYTELVESMKDERIEKKEDCINKALRLLDILKYIDHLLLYTEISTDISIGQIIVREKLQKRTNKEIIKKYHIKNKYFKEYEEKCLKYIENNLKINKII